MHFSYPFLQHLEKHKNANDCAKNLLGNLDCLQKVQEVVYIFTKLFLSDPSWKQIFQVTINTKAITRYVCPDKSLDPEFHLGKYFYQKQSLKICYNGNSHAILTTLFCIRKIFLLWLITELKRKIHPNVSLGFKLNQGDQEKGINIKKSFNISTFKVT